MTSIWLKPLMSTWVLIRLDTKMTSSPNVYTWNNFILFFFGSYKVAETQRDGTSSNVSKHSNLSPWVQWWWYLAHFDLLWNDTNIWAPALLFSSIFNCREIEQKLKSLCFNRLEVSGCKKKKRPTGVLQLKMMRQHWNLVRLNTDENHKPDTSHTWIVGANGSFFPKNS